MNRREKRELLKDKNLIVELYSIIDKYLPKLFNMFDNLTDARNKSYITYSMKSICVTRLFSLLCGLTTMTDISGDTFDNETSIKNLSQICGEDLKELPYWETIQDVFKNIKLDELREIQKYIVKTLIRSKMFDKYRYNGKFVLLFDGTGLSHHNYNLNNNCLKRKHKSGEISYYKYVLECKLLVGDIVVSLDSEFIENEEMLNENQKQDCEIKAFKRMAKRIKKNYPKQGFIMVGDGLYGNSPVINICKENNWDYIFNLKPDRLKDINSTFEENLLCENEVNIKDYFLSSNILYKDTYLNCIKYIDTNNNKELTFRYITNLDVNNSNIKEIVKIGRSRWKIENEGFYTQKHRTFNICHLNSRDDTAMKNHYFFIQIAHIIRQLLEKGSFLLKSLKNLKLKKISELILNSLTFLTPNLIDINKNFQLRFDS